MLAAMLSGRFDPQPYEDGSYFIDRDGTHFRFILNYRRDGELILPEGETFLKELEAEAKFYQIQGILDELEVIKAFEESEILIDKEHKRALKGWLPTDLEGEWCLLYRASRDGFAVGSFHLRGNDKGPTITFVQSGGNVFEGFTEKSWTG